MHISYKKASPEISCKKNVSKNMYNNSCS